MSGTMVKGSDAGSTGARKGAVTTPAGRMAALGRAELALLGRSKATLVTGVLVPLGLPFSLRPFLEDMDIEDAGLTVGLVLLPAAIGFSLLFGVYAALTAIYTARREELVLKRLRTGELRDVEVIAGSALPVVVLGLIQCLVMAVGCVAFLDVPAPESPHLVVPGVLLGLVMCAALAALTSSVTRTVESAQVTTLPFLLFSMVASGVSVPLEMLPERAASFLELLPLTPVITLVRSGWSGELSAYEALGCLSTALAWTVLAVFAVRRWFRWEPRR
ncbi:ABC transporter permease [Streptomyces sp. NPDC006172]|uniref:ABC transporter permease n=1 Tax=Streptomyces sp. NPDC006172 TaxID=3154470 RepID=UPI0033DAEC94